MKSTRMVTPVLVLLALAATALAQQSDYEIKERFRTMYESLRTDMDSAQTPEQMAQIPNRIQGLQTEFAEHEQLINGAFYPKTLESMLADLRNQYNLAQNKATTIQTQTSRIVELEGLMATLNTELETLKTEREQLLAQLRSSENTAAQQRDLIKRLNANLAANDQLVNAMVDSIFLPYGKNMDALTDVQKETLGQKLEKANILDRIAGIAQANIGFLSSTTLEAKDYASLVNQYEQFKNRWDGLREKVVAAFAASNNAAARNAKRKKGAEAAATENPAAPVDAAIADWRTKLDASFWAGLYNEFTSRGVLIQQFNDAKSFSASIRSYVESAKNSGMDTKTFVDEIWIQRIDKDWRPALESESMLGKVEYASLDQTVSQLHKERFNWQIVFWVFNIIAVIAVGWWFLTRKPKTARKQQTVQVKPNA